MMSKERLVNEPQCPCPVHVHALHHRQWPCNCSEEWRWKDPEGRGLQGLTKSPSTTIFAEQCHSIIEEALK